MAACIRSQIEEEAEMHSVLTVTYVLVPSTPVKFAYLHHGLQHKQMQRQTLRLQVLEWPGLQCYWGASDASSQHWLVLEKFQPHLLCQLPAQQVTRPAMLRARLPKEANGHIDVSARSCKDGVLWEPWATSASLHLEMCISRPSCNHWVSLHTYSTTHTCISV